MVVTERREGKAIVIAPAGRIDMVSADEFSDRLMSIIRTANQAGEPIVIDFSGVDYISSMGLRVLILAAKEAKAADSKIAVAALQPLVKEIFQISRFDKVIPCYDGVDKALAEVAAATP